MEWNGKHFNERLIIIAESIKHLQPLKVSAATLKLRVVLDEDLRDDIEDLQKLFYLLDEFGKFICEVEKVEGHGLNL